MKRRKGPGIARPTSARRVAWLVATAALALPWDHAAAGITDPAAVVRPPALLLPAAGVSYNDPGFGTPTVRIANARPEYSELQAWNADQSLILLNGMEIYDARTFQRLHTVNFGWPDWGEAIRWSPVDPLTLYYLSTNNSACGTGGALMRYRLSRGPPMSGTRQAVRCFPEYRRLLKNESFEELSDDGRYIALVAEKAASNSWGWVGEAFVYDIVNNIKRLPLQLPVDPTYGPQTSDHIAISPSGRYAVMLWPGGTARFRGTEAYDLDMNYAGKVHTGGTPHSALTRDGAGNDYLVADNANNAYLLTDRHYIVRARIPNGVVFNGSGNVDATATISSGATVPLLALDWQHNLHISGTNIAAPGWVVVSTYAGQAGYDNGWQPFEDEIFKVFLDSTPSSPRVDRLAHSRSSVVGVTPRDACNNSNYWAQPHATVSPDGSKVIFGSNWGRICDLSDPVDAFILTLGPAPADVTPPARVTDLSVSSP